ncbi:MAG: NAD(P)/FAD-dependent oxidoreductase [Candidatus Woesearchaeota archaeon]
MISIIGAGPSGSYLAYLLARAGKDVSVFEEHDEIGKPVQCTGLVTGLIKDFIELKRDFVVNEISKVKIIAPDGSEADFNLNNPNYVIDRGKFDGYVASLARKEGVKFHLGKRFSDFKDGKVLFGDGSSFASDYLVGADGVLSSVAKKFDMFNNRKFMNAMQARVKGRFARDTFVVYLGVGYFGWSVPESEEISRVGVIITKGEVKKCFEDVLEKVKGKVIEYQSGLIPLYQPLVKCSKENVFLVGDAATHCKASTHGGIVQGMIGGGALCEALIGGKDYEKLWKKKLGKDLKTHLKIREKIDKMGEDDLNYLVKLVRKEKVKKILEEYDRDHASKIALGLLLREPRFLKFVF